jgi:glycine dehydrogenase
MLKTLGLDSLDTLVKKAIPSSIQTQNPLQIGPERGETEVLQELINIARKNQIYKSFVGMGYYGTITPPGTSLSFPPSLSLSFFHSFF